MTGTGVEQRDDSSDDDETSLSVKGLEGGKSIFEGVLFPDVCATSSREGSGDLAMTD